MGTSSLKKVQRIPCGISPEDRAARLRIYNNMDVNGNGYLSLAEIDKGIRDVLDLPELFQLKPVLMRAYVAAKGKCKGQKTLSDDYVTKAEFRYLLIALKLYYNLWLEFDELDITGDKRVSAKEFKAGELKIAQWGIRLKDSDATFKGLLKRYNAQDHITFTEYCEWTLEQHLKQHPDSQNQNQLD